MSSPLITIGDIIIHQAVPGIGELMAAIDDLKREVQETKDAATALSGAVDGAVAKIDELKAVVAGLPQTAELAALAADLDALQVSMASAKAKADAAATGTPTGPGGSGPAPEV